jgi:hypothetical protein
MIVTAHIKFSLHTTFLDGAFQVEDQRLPDESIEDGAIRVYKHLENAVARLKAEHESMRGVQESLGTDNFKYQSLEKSAPKPLEINLQHERLEIEIDNCMCVDELKQWRESNPVTPFQVLRHFNTRMEILRVEENNK